MEGGPHSVPRGRGFAHIGEMLARLLSADVQGRPDDGMRATITTTAVGLGLSSLTGKQAFAIGSAIASKCVHQAHALAAVLNKVVTSHGTLQHASFMALDYTASRISGYEPIQVEHQPCCF